MINNEYNLELSNVFHTGTIESGTCLQKVMGSVPTGIILKDVSLKAHGGEVMAILGSKGSGKRALLDVISRRAQGPTRGQIILNKVPMSLSLFQETCAYVSNKVNLVSGLTVRQTLAYAGELTIGNKVSSSVKKNRVKQVLADLTLTQAANHDIDSLSPSEHIRVAIGVQLMKDPVVILLDEPNIDLDPLNTYLVASILSNYVKKYNRIVIMTMEQPRSDILPFLR
ncbi:ATP-binding cassette sub-family G member 8 [Nymphon striatum]|nr:ATP-binding cassette sub-family G member 8 [Nymphon striatum]